MEPETYTIAGLAAAVGVPRTTINDWLARYASYIDSETIGKRRVFSARTVAVLREIAALRDAGKTGFEIETELAARHGVNPELSSPPDAVAAAPANPVATGESPVPASSASPEADFPQLPALRELQRNAGELAGFMAEMRQQQACAVRRARRQLLLLAALLLLLAAVGVGAVLAVRKQAADRQREAMELRQSLAALQGDFAARLQTFDAARRAERAEAERQNAAIRRELENSRAARNAEIQRLNGEWSAERERLTSELARREKEFAARGETERRAWRADWERASRASETRLRGEIARAHEELRKLNAELLKLNAPPPAPVVQSAAAPAASPVAPPPKQPDAKP